MESSAPSNPGVGLDLDWVRGAHVDPAEVERRASSLARPDDGPLEGRAALLARVVALIDLTTLAGDDTPDRVRDLCARARSPLRPALIEALEVDADRARVAAVCVYHAMIPAAVHALAGSGIPVAAVSAGFPAGLSPFETRVAEIRASVEAGAREIDPVIARYHVLGGDWTALYREVRAFRRACGEATMKVILGTGDLGTLANVHRASLVCMMAGADFIKTSTGKEAVNATIPAGLVMSRAIREYEDRTGYRVGLKPAGGIGRAGDALAWLTLAREELGEGWLHPTLFRFGASGLLDDVARELERHLDGGPGRD